MKNKLLLLIILFVSSIYGQNPTRFPYGVQVTGGQPENTTPTYLTTTSTTGLQEKIPSAYIEKTANKTSEISGYDTSKYPNEKAAHDALNLKLNISDLPTNLTLYPTTTTSDVIGYVVMVRDIHDVRYNSTVVDVSTPTITGVGQLVSQRITDAGVLIGQPGVFNITTFGNIRRLSGSGTATFYFEVYHRDLAGVETLICTSSISNAVVNGTYAEFTASGVWDDGDFVATDRIVIKSYANRIAGGSDPVYQFQFGGASPVRTLLPVPFSVVDAGYELRANKQNDLTLDGTGTKYPTVDAVNAIDLQKVVDVNGYATITGTGLKYGAFYLDETGASVFGSNSTGDNYSEVGVDNGRVLFSSQYLTKKTSIAFNNAIENTTLNFPAKTVAGTYTLATTDETVNLTGDQTITGSKSFEVPASSNSIIFENNSSSQYANWFNLNSGGGSYFNNNSAFTSNYISNRLNGIGQFIENQSSGIASIIDSSTGSTGNLFEFKKNGTTTTYTNHLGEIITMSPTATNQVATKGYVDAKITQTITNGVTDKSPSEDAVYDSLVNVARNIINTTSTSTVTGTLTETLLYTGTIPANSLGLESMPNLMVKISKGLGGVGTMTLRVKVNSTNDFATATNLGVYIAATSANSVVFERNPTISGGNIYISNNTSSILTDISASSSANTTFPFNTTLVNYLFISIQLSDTTTDVGRLRSVKLIN